MQSKDDIQALISLTLQNITSQQDCMIFGTTTRVTIWTRHSCLDVLLGLWSEQTSWLISTYWQRTPFHANFVYLQRIIWWAKMNLDTSYKIFICISHEISSF